jgi:hypothetical protein
VHLAPSCWTQTTFAVFQDIKNVSFPPKSHVISLKDKAFRVEGSLLPLENVTFEQSTETTSLSILTNSNGKIFAAGKV